MPFPRPFLDLSSQRFERLVVVGRMPNLKGVSQTIWHVRCDCGKEKFAVLYSSLMSGRTKSCGCLHREVLSQRGPRLQRAPINPDGKMRLYEWNGEKLCLTEVCRRENVSLVKVNRLLEQGHNIHQAVRSSYGEPFIETAKTKQIPKQTRTGRLACGTDSFHVERERIKHNAWLRKCMAKCAEKGLTYRGPLPTS